MCGLHCSNGVRVQKGMDSGITYPAMQWRDKSRNDRGEISRKSREEI